MNSGKSTLIQFIEKYKHSRLSFATLKKLWKEEIDKDDFDHNEREVQDWYFGELKKIRISKGR